MRRLFKIMLILALFFSTGQMRVQASGSGPMPEPMDTGVLLDDFDFGNIQSFLDEASGKSGETISFKELLAELLAGNFSGALKAVLDRGKEALFGEIATGSKFLAQVLMIGLVGALFANFSGIFTGSQIAETGFYVTYLLLFTFLASCFYTCVGITKDVIVSIVEFMRAMVPAYFLAVSFAGGSITSAAGYGWMLLSISLVEWLFFVVFLPLIHIYILFVLAGHMMKEDMLSKATELLETGIRWGLKTTAGVVLGFHLLQSMVTPYADSIKNTSLQRFVSIIPGVGQGAAAISQLVLGSGVLIKNTIGVGAVIVLLFICAIPIVKLAVLLCSCRIVAALLQPVSDKRMVSCISAAGNGCQLLLRMVVTSLLLFAVSLAVVCMAANVTYYAG